MLEYFYIKYEALIANSVLRKCFIINTHITYMYILYCYYPGFDKFSCNRVFSKNLNGRNNTACTCYTNFQKYDISILENIELERSWIHGAT
jgi:hypothetical protein